MAIVCLLCTITYMWIPTFALGLDGTRYDGTRYVGQVEWLACVLYKNEHSRSTINNAIIISTCKSSSGASFTGNLSFFFLCWNITPAVVLAYELIIDFWIIVEIRAKHNLKMWFITCGGLGVSSWQNVKSIDEVFFFSLGGGGHRISDSCSSRCRYVRGSGSMEEVSEKGESVAFSWGYQKIIYFCLDGTLWPNIICVFSQDICTPIWP